MMMRTRFFFYILTILLYPFSSGVQAQIQKPEFTKYDSLRGALNPYRTCIDVSYYNLNLKINPADSSIGGYNEITFTAKSKSNIIQIDLFANWNIDRIVESNQTLAYTRDSNVVFITVAKPLSVGEHRSITIFYHGNPTIAKKAPWDGGFVWQKDSLNNYWTGVACEGIGASLWWPCKDHLSDEPDSMDMTFEVPSGYTAVGNGRLIAEEKLDNKFSRFRWHVSYPINTYNVTVNVAKYEHFAENHLQKNGTLLDLNYYVLSYNLEKAKKHFNQVHKMLDIYEQLFSAYPFPKDSYKMVETPYWGMEHQSAISYGNDYVNDVIDWDYIIIHESAHEWWGNNVSTVDHGELWIHESFATYTEALLIEASYNYETAIKYLYYQRPRIKNTEPIIGPLNVNYEGWEGSDMYYKGAWALHTLRNYINNDELWFAMFPAIQKKFALQTISSTDLITFINGYLGQDLNWFFNQYFYKAGIPELNTSIKFKKKKAIVQLQWKDTVKDFKLPVYFIDSDNNLHKIIPTDKLSKHIIKIPDDSKKLELVDYLYYISYKEIKTE
jgi:aminopeptidase N